MSHERYFVQEGLGKWLVMDRLTGLTIKQCQDSQEANKLAVRHNGIYGNYTKLKVLSGADQSQRNTGSLRLGMPQVQSAL